MANIEEKSLAALIARLDVIKAELSELENDIRALAESVPEEVPAPVEIPEPEVVAEPVEIIEPEAVSEPVEIPEPEEVPEPVEIKVEEDIPEEIVETTDDSPIDLSISEIEMPVPPPVVSFDGPKKSILDVAKADTAVMDVMAEKQAWRTDRPGMPVKNIISAISLNDRVLLINVLFGEDPMLFQETSAKFNSMGSLSEDMNSEPVYRLMMAVRRKLG